MTGVVVVVLRSAFAVLRFAAVNVVVEIHMSGLVGPSHIQPAFWPFLPLKKLKPIYLSESRKYG